MSNDISRRDLLRVLGTGVALPGAANAIADSGQPAQAPASLSTSSATPSLVSRGVVADPALIPPPIKRNHLVHHQIAFAGREVIAEIEPGAPGARDFDSERMLNENATYVVFNGAFNAITGRRFGAMKAKVGETIRVFMVNGGPNLLSSLHPIGDIWSRAWLWEPLRRRRWSSCKACRCRPAIPWSAICNYPCRKPSKG